MPAGSPTFTLTLNGTGFSPGSVVSVNGNYPAVTYVSPTQLTVHVNAAWVSSPTNFDVYVENYPSGTNGCAVFGYYTFTVTGFVRDYNHSNSRQHPDFCFHHIYLDCRRRRDQLLSLGRYHSRRLRPGQHGAFYRDQCHRKSAHQRNHDLCAPMDVHQRRHDPALQRLHVHRNWRSCDDESGKQQYADVGFDYVQLEHRNGRQQLLPVVGTTPGGYDLANQGPFTGTGANVTLPTNGTTIYVRLWSFINGGATQLHNDYTYTEFSVSAAAITSPAPGSTLTSASTTFTWGAATGASSYYLWVGTTLGGYNLANMGPFTGTSATANLPTNGTTIYVRLWTFINGGTTQLSNDYTYAEFAPSAAAITSPAPGSTLTSASTTFTWNAVTGPSSYYIWVGTTLGGYDLANQGPFTGTSATLTLPTNGTTIYVRLWTFTNGGATQLHNDYTYIEASVAAAAIASPPPSSTLLSASTTFTWNAVTGASSYYLWVSTTPGGYDLANLGPFSGASANVTLPTNGTTIYVRLWTFINGTPLHNDYTYTEAP